MRRVLDQFLLGQLEALGLALARLGQRPLRLIYAVRVARIAADLGRLTRSFGLLLGHVVVVAVNFLFAHVGPFVIEWFHRSPYRCTHGRNPG